MYRFEGTKIFSEKSGKHVANLNGDALAFQPGMAMQHKRKLGEWLEGKGMKTVKPIAAVEPEPKKEYQKETLPPLSQLQKDPPFEKHLGTLTPGFADWAKDKTPEQITAMVRKLER